MKMWPSDMSTMGESGLINQTDLTLEIFQGPDDGGSV